MNEPWLDKWESSCGRAVMYRGESLAVLRELPAGEFDALVTDPPYSSGGTFRGDRSRSTSEKYVNPVEVKNFHPEFTGDNRDQRAYAYWCTLWFSECLRIVRTGGVLEVFTDWRQLPTTTDAVQAGGWVWRGIVVWDKTRGTRPHPGRFRQQAEFVVWGTNGPSVVDGEPDYPEGVFLAAPFHGKQHIAGKPVPLMEHLLRVVAKGGLVLDPFAGSATTGVACLKTGRRFVGIEQDPHYFGVCVERLKAELDRAPLFAATASEADGK